MKKEYIISIALIIVLSLGGGYQYYKYKYPKNTLLKIEEPKEEVVNHNNTTPKDGVNVATVAEHKSITGSDANIVTVVPINGTLKGVIEVGASGFNAFVVDIDRDKNWELVSKDFGASLAYEGFANTNDVYEQMKKYITIITDKGVSGRNIHFVISSGALKNPKMELIAKAIKEKGFTVNKVTAEQEGKYALKALLPKIYRENSFVVDMGSGNTKISWYENGNPKSVETYGAKFYQDGKTDTDVYQSIIDALSKVPTSVRTNCFIIGGVPFKLAKESRVDNERFTVLKNPDEYSGGDDVKVKSGLTIYRAIYDNAGTSNYIFDWDANFTIGFLMSLN